MYDFIVSYNPNIGLFQIRQVLFDNDDIAEYSDPIVEMSFTTEEEALCFTKQLYDSARWQFIENLHYTLT